VARWVIILVVWGVLTSRICAQNLSETTNAEALTKLLRAQLLKHCPTPLIESQHDWGKQKEITVGLKWSRHGVLNWTAVPQKAMRNDGHWHTTTVTAIDPEKTLGFGLMDVRQIDETHTTFRANIGLNVDLKFQQQLWASGLRLYSGETRGRCRAAVKLQCELTNRAELKKGSTFPDFILRLRVTEAELFYEDLVVEHTLGIGGEAAHFLGEAGHKLLTRVKPSLERDLIAKANAAIVKAADTKEVRLELEKLIESKPSQKK
jgi:hypothetical protein